MLSEEEKERLVRKGLVIYHALEEMDWERTKKPAFKKNLSEIKTISMKCNELVHPPIIPEYSAKKLEESISKRDRENALLSLNEILLACFTE